MHSSSCLKSIITLFRDLPTAFFLFKSSSVLFQLSHVHGLVDFPVSKVKPQPTGSLLTLGLQLSLKDSSSGSRTEATSSQANHPEDFTGVTLNDSMAVLRAFLTEQQKQFASDS